MNDAGPFHGHYNVWLVFLSFAIAMVSAYASFSFATRLRFQSKQGEQIWLLSGSCALGIGIWSMHFVGMLAHSLPINMHYHIGYIIVSILFATGGCYLALAYIHYGKNSLFTLLFATFFMGSGIVLMHYIGMSAMASVIVSYTSSKVLLSIYIAFIASFIALRVAFYTNYKLTWKMKLICAAFMAIAITGMNYMGMNAAQFYPKKVDTEVDSYINPAFFSVVIAIFIMTMFLMIFLTIYMDERTKHQLTLQQAIFHSSTEAIFITNEEGNILGINEKGEEFFHIKKQEVSGEPITNCLSFLTKVSSSPQDQIYSTVFINDKQYRICVNITKATFEFMDQYIISVRDVTEEHFQKKQLEEATNRYRSLFDISPLSIVLHKGEEIISVNARFLKMLHFEHEKEIVGRNITEFIDKSQRQHIKNRIDQFMKLEDEDSFFIDEVKVKTNQNHQLSVQATSTVIIMNGENYIQTITQDVTENHRAKETLQYLNSHDSLTDLPNRTLFHQIVKQDLWKVQQENKQAFMLSIDIDRFKQINDTIGHHGGDQVLIEAIRRIKSCLGSNDTLSRMGGDEFMLYSPQAKEEVFQLADRLLEVFVQPFIVNKYKLYHSISIGISKFQEDGVTVETLVRNADLAMNEVKKLGRNGWKCYEPLMKTYVNRRMEIEDGLRQALKRNEFALHYQPKVNIIKGEIVGVEALIRWNHPEMGFLSPGEFIPIAEESGLIVPMTQWVLREACSQGVRWKEEGFSSLKISVNISSVEFAEPSFVDMILSILEETGFSPNKLELEITESVAMKHVDLVIEKLVKLKKHGISIAIDDFGAGYSSFSYLKRLPIHTLKIDRSFIQNLYTDSREAAIVSSIISLAKSLDLSIVAEGVEERDQALILHQERCDEIQGYYFSRPIPPDELKKVAGDMWEKIKDCQKENVSSLSL
ncbi:EAL domain-containing protein [Priestia filamentosa]|uniref:bifunctional diguanylate cyclase/phosphodiesterase n=1 Tax=Priestia filamentosa TaxID=1402861 RepID=UPI002E1FC941|nr:EAL domain-containing protein [Priestia filamentosa]